MKQKLSVMGKQIISQKEVVIALVLAVVLSSLALTFFIHKNPKVPPKPKNAVSVASNVVPASNGVSATTGEELNWQKSVHATEDNANIDGTVVEEIDKNQVFDGNLRLPKGWAVQYSCSPHGTAAESRVYVSSIPSGACTSNAAVTYLKLNTGTAQTLKPFSQAPLVQPLYEKALSNEPFKTLSPIIFNNKVFQVMQAVNVQDAGSTNDFTINCFDLTTYATCITGNSATFPTYLSTTIGQLGTGPKNINTALNMQSYVDVDGTYGHKGYLYMPGQTYNSYGVVCVDLVNLANCGFTSLGTSGPANSTPSNLNPVLLSGFTQSDGKLYGHANDADKTYQTVVCFDMTTQASCTGFTANTTALTPTYLIAEHYNAYLTTGSHVLDGTRLYWTVNYSATNSQATQFFPASDQRNWGTVITCFDLSTKAQCSGWPNQLGGVELFGTGGGLYLGNQRPNTLFAWRNTNGSVKGMCLIVGLGSGVDPTMMCYNVANGVALNDINGTPGHPGKMFPAQWLTVPWLSSPNITNVTDSEGAKTYFPFYSTSDLTPTSPPRRGATFCWNWTTASACASFAAPKYWHDINGGVSGDTGYSYDGSCMVGVGYGDKIWSFNAQTGESPCRVARTKYTASLSPNDFYCDNGTHVFSWGKVRLAKASIYDFDSFNVVVKGSDGATVLTQDNLKSNAEIDLSSIPYSANQQLTIEVVSTVFNTSPWAHSNLPFVNIVASADDAQYCYKTKATQHCDVHGITTSSDATIVTDDDTLTNRHDTTIPLAQAPDKLCDKDVKASLSSDKTAINTGDEVTYTMKVENLANLNEFGLGIISGAKYQVTFPSSFTYVSSSDGGVLDGNKVTWDSQTIGPKEIQNKTLTLRAPSSVSFLDDVKAGHVYAATTQTLVAVQGVVIAGDDVNQADNNTSDNNVILTSVTPDPPDDGGGPTTPPDDGGGGTTNPPDNGGGGTTTSPDNGGETTPTDTSGGGTTTTPETGEGSPELPGLIFQPDTTTTNGTTRKNTATADGTPIALTPRAIKSIIPPSFASQTETFFKGVNAAIAPIPNSVAQAIPYGVIGFLAAFAVIYGYQAIQEARTRKRIKGLTERFKRTEVMRKNYIDLTSHYLHTPITVMQSTVELLRSLNQLPQDVAVAAKERLDRLVGHSELLLTDSQALSDESAQTVSSLNEMKLRPFFLTSGFILPIIGVLLAALIANVLFVWGEKYSFNSLTFGVQTSFYLLGVVAMAVALNSFRRQRYATSIAEKEFNLEQEITASQATFITNTGNTLQTDIVELDQLAPSIVALPKGNIFANGLASLKDALAKMAYLNVLTTHQVVPTIATDTLKDLAEEVVKRAQTYADTQHVKLHVSIEPGLTALVDFDGYRQLLGSTLDNAIKFSQPGGEVSLSIARASEKTIKITVSDQGKGIPKEKIDQLFTPFARGTDTLRFNYEGFGLDLYMDKLIAEQCGGDIAIESIEGKGTTVIITLPS